MNTCTQRHSALQRKGYAFCPHCLKKLIKPEIGFDAQQDRFTRDNIFITDEEAPAAWNDVGSCFWSVGAVNVMSNRVMHNG